MAQIFNINKNATLPNLRLRLNADGRNDFKKAFHSLQNCDVTFTMTNKETGIRKISKAKAYVVPMEDTCNDEYCIEYRWNKRDTNEEGKFVGSFNIRLYNDIKQGETIFPEGDLIVPISEELIINVQSGSLKK